MKLKSAIERIGHDQATTIARQACAEFDLNWERGLCHVFRVIASNPEHAPRNIGGANDDEHGAIRKWLRKYKNGIASRASVRTSNLPGTIADPLIEEIIGARLDNLQGRDLKAITHAHRLSMSAENILGLILEEYLAVNLEPTGWHCAWGETVKSVDFVHEDGALLQIKNRSNSENSSSSTVRDGTDIKKWYRIKADREEYMWGKLNDLCQTGHLNEDSFVRFTRETIRKNPTCLAIEAENIWAQ